MIGKIQKWGNSQGVRFPKTILEEARVRVGDHVKVWVQGGQIIVEPTSRDRGGHDLADLVSRMPDSYEVEELDWGQPAGKEVW